MKIVINVCHGGFGLSDKAMRKYAELKSIKLYPEKDKWGGYTYYTVPEEQRAPKNLSDRWHEMNQSEKEEANKRWISERLYDKEIARNDPTLVQVVKELGKDANGRFASLKVVNVPDDVKWEIDEYDGYEHVAEVHRTWE